MFISHHIAAALASERERDFVANARHRDRSEPDVEAAGVEPFFTPEGSGRPSPAPERDGRLALRVTRARGVEAGRSANVRSRERVGTR
jgi:hypothetical protein